MWKFSSPLATLFHACEAHLGKSRHISAHLDSISESRPVIEVRGTARHISAQLGASRSHGQSSTGKVCEDAPDRRPAVWDALSNVTEADTALVHAQRSS